MSSAYLPITITHIHEEVPGGKTFVFAEEDTKSIRYKPGQYLTLVAPDAQEEVRRSYSITSSPVLDEPLTIGVKRIENGLFSRRLIDHARVGDQLLTIGAAGFFTLPENMSAYRQVFFWAAGSGITPIYALLKTILHQHPTVSIVLVYSNHDPDSTIFHAELKQLEESFADRLTIIFLFSIFPRLDQARLHKDLLKRIVKENARVSLAETLCYICGPENYRRLCLYGLREVGVPAENIRQETFNITKTQVKVTPPDVEAHHVIAYYGGETYRFQAQYPDTILQAATKAGFTFPYSCEAGRCGNCAAKCLEGTVWMSYNEVLTDRDVARGLALTCVGYPVGGDVTLKVL